MPRENDLEGVQDQGGKHGGQKGMPKPSPNRRTVPTRASCATKKDRSSRATRRVPSRFIAQMRSGGEFSANAARPEPFATCRSIDSIEILDLAGRHPGVGSARVHRLAVNFGAGLVNDHDGKCRIL